jgi:hypothetical protein
VFSLIQRLKHRLGLSHGQLIALAREVAEEDTLYSLHQLTADQLDKLVLYMTQVATRRIDAEWVV